MPDETAIAPPAAISDEEATQKPWEMFAAKKPWQLFAPAPAPSAAVPPPPAPRFDTAKVKLDPYQESFLKTGTTEPSQQSFENWLSWHPPGKQGIGPATGISELTGWDRLKFSIQNKLESVFPGMAEKGSPSPASVVGGAAMVAPLGLPENLGKLLLGYFAYRTAKAQPDIYRQIKSEIQSGNYSEAQRTAVEDILQMGMIGTGAAGLREPAPTPTPYAREIQTSATVHGDLRPQPISREGPVPVPKSGGGIQPQAEGRLPQAPPGQVPLTPEARPGQMPPVEAGPPTGARGGPIPGAPPSQVSLTLALLVDGKPMTGGKDHIEIRDNLAKGSDAQADAALAAFAEDKNHVFLDENKNVLTREQAGARLGLKELHSGDLETLPKPLTASEVLARPPDGVSALEIAVMPGKELLDLIQRRGPKNELLYPPQRGAVLWGMKQPASELPKLEMMRDEANRQNQATFAKTSQLDMVAQTKSFWYSAAIEGIREEGGNYAAVKAETPPPTIQPAVKPVALEPKGDVKEISQLPEKAKIAESEPVLAQGPGAMTAKPSVRPGRPEVFEGTALKNAVGELEHLGFDLAEATSTMRSEMAQSWLRSGKTLAQNPEAGRQLADQLKWNPEMGLTDDQSALLLRHKVTLENSLNDAAERTHTAKDPTARATAQKEYERLGNEFTELLDAIKHGRRMGPGRTLASGHRPRVLFLHQPGTNRPRLQSRHRQRLHPPRGGHRQKNCRQGQGCHRRR